MSGNLTFPNLKQAMADLHKQPAIANAMLAKALYEEAEEIMTDSKANYVPVDTGVLRSSGFVNPPVIEGNRVYVELGFGGAAEDYALIQHERLDFHHTVGQAKFLETPINNAANGLDARLAQRMRR